MSKKQEGPETVPYSPMVPYCGAIDHDVTMTRARRTTNFL